MARMDDHATDSSQEPDMEANVTLRTAALRGAKWGAIISGSTLAVIAIALAILGAIYRPNAVEFFLGGVRWLVPMDVIGVLTLGFAVYGAMIGAAASKRQVDGQAEKLRSAAWRG